MFNVDPNQLIQMIKRGQNPQQLMLNVLQQSAQSSPMGANLLNLVQNGQTQEIEKIARNMCKERGVDFDQEFANFRRTFGL